MHSTGWWYYCGGVTFGNLKVTYWPNVKVTKSIDSITFKRNAPLFTCALEEGRVYYLYIFQFDLISNQILISIWKCACIRGPNPILGLWKKKWWDKNLDKVPIQWCYLFLSWQAKKKSISPKIESWSRLIMMILSQGKKACQSNTKNIISFWSINKKF